MLVFLSSYPTDDNIRDGMMQRVAAIDSLVSEEKRVYLNLSYKRNLSRITKEIDGCKIEFLNFFLHFFIIRKYLRAASKVYVHSIFNLFRIHLIYQPSKTILDIHGVVPEELSFVNKKVMAFVFGLVEKKAIKKCYKLICVTNAMLIHYQVKYKCDLKSRALVLPIFESGDVIYSTEKWKSEKIKVAYAGGLQAWQNIEMMVDAVKKSKENLSFNNYEFHFFFPESSIELFQNKYPHLVSLDYVFISSLPKDEILMFLSTCHYGFILRDDILVNNVACPTKLIEYLECGVLPIVKYPNIGDFFELGYKFVTLEDFLANTRAGDELGSLAYANKAIFSKFREDARKTKTELVSYLK